MFRITVRWPLAASVLVVSLGLASAAWGQSAADQSSAVLGKHLYRGYCASCHGATATGDGALAEYLTIPPTDLTTLAKANGGEFPMARTLAVIDGRESVKGHGGGEMPAWGEAFQQISGSEAEVAAKVRQLALYLETIQKE